MHSQLNSWTEGLKAKRGSEWSPGLAGEDVRMSGCAAVAWGLWGQQAVQRTGRGVCLAPAPFQQGGIVEGKTDRH